MSRRSTPQQSRGRTFTGKTSTSAISTVTVTAITPTTGTSQGGTAITNLAGTGFVNGATVTIGGVAATGVTWVSSTKITCTSPAGTAGAKDVVVTNPDTGAGTGTALYMYTAWRSVITWRGKWAETVVGSPNITQWTDLSGNGRHFTASANHPTVGGAGFNSKPNIAFNGTTNTFINAALMSDVFTAAAGYLVAAVNLTAVSTATTSDQDATILADNSGYMAAAFDSRQTTNAAGPPPSFRGYVYDGAEKNANSAFDTAKVKIVEMWWDGANVNSRVNGGATTSTASGNIQLVTGFLRCGSQISGGFFNGNCAALGVTNAVPSLANRNAIAADMIAEFGAT